MTQLTFRTTEEYFEPGSETSRQMMKYFIETIEKQKPDRLHHSLIQAYVKLYEMMEELQAENQAIRTMLKREIQEESCIMIPNISFEEIKEMILQEIKVGEVFYPSDLANKFGLDLKTVMEVVNNLKTEGKMIEKLHNDVSP